MSARANTIVHVARAHSRADECKRLARCAAAGDALSAFKLACLYADGHDDVPCDHDAAFPLLQQAHRGGLANATVRLAQAYLYGRGTVPDTALARRLLRRAADVRDPMALFELGCLVYDCSGQPRRASAALRYWIGAGPRHAGALIRIGLARMFDGTGQPDYTNAMALFRCADDVCDSARARFLVGCMHFCGCGTQPNVQVGLRTWQRAASAGSEDARAALAFTVQGNAAVATDVVMAHEQAWPVVSQIMRARPARVGRLVCAACRRSVPQTAFQCGHAVCFGCEAGRCADACAVCAAPVTARRRMFAATCTHPSFRA